MDLFINEDLIIFIFVIVTPQWFYVSSNIFEYSERLIPNFSPEFFCSKRLSKHLWNRNAEQFSVNIFGRTDKAEKGCNRYPSICIKNECNEWPITDFYMYHWGSYFDSWLAKLSFLTEYLLIFLSSSMQFLRLTMEMTTTASMSSSVHHSNLALNLILYDLRSWGSIVKWLQNEALLELVFLLILPTVIFIHTSRVAIQ
jgi:hypothetical protein